jgi:regulator of sirC expression with transglutaminase-like and TPR domain
MSSALDDYQNLILEPEAEWNLFRISLEIGRILIPRIDFAPHFQLLEEVQDDIRSSINPESDTYSVIEAINQALFGENGFSGNERDYYDPQNSMMPNVLERRKGIPITLSILYREVAHHVGLKLGCVAMPGHFLLKCRMPQRELFIDAYHRGQILLEDECYDLMESVTGSTSKGPEALATAANSTVILRLLMNLKAIYRQQGNLALLLEVMERRIPLLPDPLPEILERGLTKLSLEHYAGALEDIEYYLAHAQDTSMKEVVEQQIDRIRRLARGD